MSCRRSDPSLLHTQRVSSVARRYAAHAPSFEKLTSTAGDVFPEGREFAAARIIAVQLIFPCRSSGKNGVSARGGCRKIEAHRIVP